MKILALILALLVVNCDAAQIFLTTESTAPPQVNSKLPAALQWLAVKTPGNLPCLVWSNVMSQTNKSERQYVSWDSISNVVRNTNCLIYPAYGSTGIFQTYLTGDGHGGLSGSGGVPGVLVTRRHVIIRGHDNGWVNVGQTNGVWGTQILFYDRTNGVYVATATNALGHVYDTNYPGLDYCLMFLTADVPANIEPVPQIYAAEYFAKYASALPAVSPYTQPLEASIYPACVSWSAPGFPSFLNAGGPWVGGTSGSPNLLLMPTATGETLLMYSGRTTSGISAQMLADIAALTRTAGLDPSNPDYQPQIVSLSQFPNL